MKTTNYSLIRILFALVIGLVLVIWPDAAAAYIVITLGVAFLIPGIITLFAYFGRKRGENKKALRFPIEGVGSLLLGLWLIIMPDFFADVLMFLLGFILIMGGVQQITSLARAREWIRVPAAFYLIPVLILIAGFVTLFNPTEARNTAFLIIGICSLVYAVSELVNWFKFMRFRPESPLFLHPEEVEDDAGIID
ncbi:HdeD family acid-resistance protein [Bacteroides pyogenes]|uniref:HdeD family acid-resistance protein n=1 Tax=Bacteroides pyogenes TaxID=310300 RepID=UPI0003DB7BA9|nr:DUF308 domain-containing protein [Bacteroides pyogenes]MBB3894816.1 uncharacterized membrane protein HdeD (DUF308 family) [Bacteroides pyogenes]GAE21186.1 hypothetical protein JCM10003_598 [Bacteroides pyogenes JCM 10003]SUV35279.1 acid-resistance membrane protein [Bacteroides pyogenes]